MPDKHNCPTECQAVFTPLGVDLQHAVATTPTNRSTIERMFLTFSLKPLPLALTRKGDL